jgi:filamentous hemagglutinin family protein
LSLVVFGRMRRFSDRVSGLSQTLLLGLLLNGQASQAQIVPAADGTGTMAPAIVQPDGTTLYAIGGGTQTGQNLFHSFQQFNLAPDQVANFLAAPNIQNILGRIGGGDAAVINGLLQVTGNANLYLLNPAGMVFGPNARLQVPGSFTATTANRIGFSAGQFNAVGANNYADLLGQPTSFDFLTAQTGAIANAGNLTVGPGQNLTLLGGTVISTGQLTAPGGQIMVATVPGTTRVQLSSVGSPLRLELQPIANATTLLPTPQTLPQLLTGGNLVNASGLTIAPDGTVYLTGAAIPVKSGDLVVQNLTAANATLAAAQNLSLVAQTQPIALNTTDDLTLTAGNTVRVRNSEQQSVLVQAGGNLRLQGDRAIDILALNQAMTPFQAGRNLSLVSAGVISGDAHYQAGGQFSILNQAGQAGNFISLYDPIIVANGDVTLGNYTGASLWVEAGGSITSGNILINAIDPNIGPHPTLILRAGQTIAPSLINLANGTTAGGFTATANTVTPATLQVGQINFSLPNGQVVLVAPGNLQTGAINSQGGNVLIEGGANGGTITATTINTQGSGRSGDITLIANNLNSAITTGNLTTASLVGNSGQISLFGGNIQTGDLDTSIQDNATAGLVQIYGTRNVVTGLINTSGKFGIGGKVNGFATENLTVAGIAATGQTGGQVDLTSSNGDITLTEDINTLGNITLHALKNIDTRVLQGGQIKVTATEAAIVTGTIVAGANSALTLRAFSTISTRDLLAPGGTVEVVSNQGNLRLGAVETSAFNGGDVKLGGIDIALTSINAQGLGGRGGSVATLSESLQVNDAFLDQNNQLASIATSGGQNSGTVNIKIAVPNTAPDVTFTVGEFRPLNSDSREGWRTQAAIVTAKTTIAPGTKFSSTGDKEIFTIADFTITLERQPPDTQLFPLLPTAPPISDGGFNRPSLSLNLGAALQAQNRLVDPLLGAGSPPGAGPGNAPPAETTPESQRLTRDRSADQRNADQRNADQRRAGQGDMANPTATCTGNDAVMVTTPNPTPPDYPAVIRCYQRQLASGQTSTRAQTLYNLGVTYYTVGAYAEAIAHYQKALNLAQAAQDGLTTAQAQLGLGTTFGALGDNAKAITYYEQSLISPQLPPRFQAITLRNLAITHLNQGNSTAAATYQQQSLKLVQQLNNRQQVGQVLADLGTTYFSAGNYQQAITVGQQALTIAREFGDQADASRALNALSLAYYGLQDFTQSGAYSQQQLDIARLTGDRASEGQALTNLGDAQLQAGQPVQATQTLYSALGILESLRSNLGQDDANKISLFDLQATAYNTLEAALVAQNQPHIALEVAERGRARSFVELLARKLATTPVKALKPAAAAKAPNLAEIKRIAKTQNATLVEYSVIRHNFEVAGRRQLKESQLHIWVVQPTGAVTFRQVDLKPLWQRNDSSLRDLVTLTRDAIGVRGLAVAEFNADPNLPAGQRRLRQLHRLLIDPIADLLPTNPEAEVVLIPQGELFMVPFAALPDANRKYLIERHTLLSAPAIQVLDLAHQLKSQRPTAQFTSTLIVGNPTMPSLAWQPGEASQPLPSLPGAEQEANAIAKLLKLSPLIGDQATKATVLQKLPQADVIHFATHGLLDDFSGSGMPGAIALAPSNGDNGILTASEILDLKLTANLVVLSACNTGRGRITGDGVVGLSRSLIAAGVPSVVVSLWAVPDDSTAALMTEFYQTLQTQPNKAQALRQAMLKTLQQYPDPRDWAAFMLVGES